MNIHGEELLICEYNSKLENVYQLDALLDNIASQFTLSDELQFKIKCCLYEAFSNAVIHGNQFSLHKTVIVTCHIVANCFRLIIKDEGLGFFHEDSASSYVMFTDSSRFSGRGLGIIHKLCDNVSFLDRGRAIQLDFNL